MDFTELYQQSAAAVIFSPGAHFILNAVADRLVVRRADTLQIARTWRVDTTPSATNASFHAASQQQQQQHIASASNNTDALVSNLAWSSDSEYILAAIPKRGVVNVYMMRDDNWSARIEAGTEGLTKAVWAPDGRTILCFSEWGVSTFRSYGASNASSCRSSLSALPSCEFPPGHLSQALQPTFSFLNTLTKVPFFSPIFGQSLNYIVFSICLPS